VRARLSLAPQIWLLFPARGKLFPARARQTLPCARQTLLLPLPARALSRALSAPVLPTRGRGYSLRAGARLLLSLLWARLLLCSGRGWLLCSGRGLWARLAALLWARSLGALLLLLLCSLGALLLLCALRCCCSSPGLQTVQRASE
jgi:hypothetical protein